MVVITIKAIKQNKGNPNDIFEDTSYVSKVRVNKSIDLLKNTNIKVNDIASMVGFKNKNYFYSVFKKYYGITPTEIRKET